MALLNFSGPTQKAYGIFLTFQSRNFVKKFSDYINKKHPNIYFTFEIEDQNSFLFLEIKLLRNTEKKPFQTLFLSKSTFNGVFTKFSYFNFDSHDMQNS